MTASLQHSDWLNGRVPDEVRVQLRRLVEVIGYLPYRQPMGVITADAVLLAANRPLLDLLGATGDELLDADWDDYMPGWSERVGASDAAPGAEPRTLVFEEYLLTKAGDPLWVSVVASPVLTQGTLGGPAATTAAEEPVSLAAWTLFAVEWAPRSGETEERRRQEILELLLESPSEFVVQLNSEGRVAFLSPSLLRTLGVGADDLEGQDLAAAHGMAGVGFGREFGGLLEELSHPPFRAERESVMATTAGERVVHWAFESLIADGGELRSVLGVGRDVTARRHAERELEQSELRLRTLVETTSPLIWTTGHGGVVDSPNDSWTAFTGQSGVEMLGDGWAGAVHPDDRERVRRSWSAAVAARLPYQCEYRLRNASGEYRWIETHAVPLPGDEGEVRYFGAGQDVTQRKRAEESVLRRLDLERMMSAISSRFANVKLDSALAAIDYALGEVGRLVGADHISLYDLEADGVTTRGVRVWRRETNQVADEEPALELGELDWLRGRLVAHETVAVGDTGDLPPEAATERALFDDGGLSAVLIVPIAQDTNLIGLLALGVETARGDDSDAGERDWDDDDLYLLRLLADQLAGLLVWRSDEMNLRSVSDAFLSFGSDVDENITGICRAAVAVSGADFALYNRRRGDDLVAETGWNVPQDLPRSTKAAGRVCADVLARPDGQVLIVRDLQDSVYAHTSPIVRRYGLRTYVGFPIAVGGRAVASLCCLFVADVVLRESQIELLRVLGRAAAVEEERRRAIEERLLGLAQLEQAMERTVGTLSGAMGTRDPYTIGHERRVAQLAVAIGLELGMDRDDLRLLRVAGMVHDVGKFTVPSEILSKPARLSEAELAIIQGHSKAGWELLEPAGLPTSVTDAVLQHHERLDGSGYPAGLAGDGIGEFARIVAVADVVEAMSSDRPYRPAVGVEPALAEIEEGRGVRYDERATDACLRLFREKGFSFDA